MKTYRSAIIGCGQIGSQYEVNQDALGIFTHAQAYHACDNTSLEGICDINEDALSACAQKWKISNTYNSIDDLLKDGPWDIISLCTPDQTHAKLSQHILDFGQTSALFIEKPLAVDTKSAATIMEQVKRLNIPVQINYSRRFDPKYQWLKEAIRNKEFGTIRKILIHYTGGIFHNGSHALDMIYYLFGKYKVQHATTVCNLDKSDPTIDALCMLEDGTAFHLIGHPAETYSIFEGNIWGSNGCLHLRDSGTRFVIDEIRPSKLAEGYKILEPTRIIDETANSTFHAINEICKHLEDKSSPLSCTVDDAYHAVSMAEAICTAARP
jgi:predicted dehydrogenase